MKQKAVIEFTKEQQESLAAQLQLFLADELDLHTGNMDARRLLDFAAQMLGPICYNKAIEDASAFMFDKVDDLFALLKD